MTRTICIVGLVLSAGLYWWSSSVWGRCGYDCGIFDVATGPTAIVASVAAIVVFAVSVVTLVINVVRKRTGS